MNAFAPLQGVRVIDFSKILAGPLCTQYLADLGAEVIKVEPIGTGDDTRHWPPFENGVGTVFLSVNRNKGSLAIDLKSPAGREACRRLAKVSDLERLATRAELDVETPRDLSSLAAGLRAFRTTPVSGSPRGPSGRPRRPPGSA